MTLICTFPCVFIIVSSAAVNPGKEKPCSPSSCVPVLQGWRSPGFLVSRASSYSSSSSCNSSDVSPSSSAPSVDSGGSSPLPGERPPCPRDHQSHTHKTQPQTARWLVHAFVLSIRGELLIFVIWSWAAALWGSISIDIHRCATSCRCGAETKQVFINSRFFHIIWYRKAQCIYVTAAPQMRGFAHFLSFIWCLFRDVKSQIYIFLCLYALLFKIHIIFLMRHFYSFITLCMNAPFQRLSL